MSGPRLGYVIGTNQRHARVRVPALQGPCQPSRGVLCAFRYREWRVAATVFAALRHVIRNIRAFFDLVLAAPTVGVATVTRPGATTRRTGTSGAYRLRRRWTSRADARRRGAHRLDPRAHAVSCGHHAQPGVRAAQGGVTLQADGGRRCLAGLRLRWTPGETGARSAPDREQWGSEPARCIPAATTAKANRATRADSGEVSTRDGRGFDSPRLHYTRGQEAAEPGIPSTDAVPYGCGPLSADHFNDSRITTWRGR